MTALCRSGTIDQMVPSANLDGAAVSVQELNGTWEFAELPAGHELGAGDLPDLVWRPAVVPGTVAGTFRTLGELDETTSSNLDSREFVYRRTFRHAGGKRAARLVFDGLATFTDVWLNGVRILATRNMFRQFAVDVSSILQVENNLVLHFLALSPEFARKRARGRWATRLVKHRNLRYVRTTLLGRMPGWSPSNPPVGPWRGVRLEHSARFRLAHLTLHATLDRSDGVLSIALKGHADLTDRPASVEVRVADQRASFPVTGEGVDGFRAEGEIRVREVCPWWSQDLGTPRRYPVSLKLQIGSEAMDIGTVQVGFRKIEMCGGTEGAFSLRLNGQDVFCRGACWIPTDAVGFGDDPAEIRRTLGLVRDAGMNMIRLSGTTIYESDAFYEACDEFGIMVWQDFMFASMDYPEADAEFAEEVRNEVEQVLARIHHHPCLAVLCGGSEVAQQAAMNGLAPATGLTPLFQQVLRDAGGRWCPELPFVPSSPTGGAMPFHVDAGVAHYFGVGAYLRTLADARESRVRFASECLAFSNVPEDLALDELFGGEPRVTHSPRYKDGVPRDSGSGWDFSDVTDHYVEQLFDCNVRNLRYADTERYLAFARVTPGELMERTFGLWRTEESLCRGALVWTLRDLRAGSGWGVLDSSGRPKAAYWFLKRACAPTTIWFTDEGLNGLRVHVRNDRLEVLSARVRVRLVRANGVDIGHAETEVLVEGNSGCVFSVDAMLGRFADTTYAYRFGACEHSIAVAELFSSKGALIATAHHLPTGFARSLRDDIALHVVVRSPGDGSHHLSIESRSLALFVRISAEGYLSADNYFHIPPAGTRTIVLSPQGTKRPLRGYVAALNRQSPVIFAAGEDN